MKLRDVAKGRRAVKRVPFLPATAGAAQPGRAPLEAHSEEILLGVRVLSGDETVEVYEKATAAARRKGVEQWSTDNPICRLYEMAHTVLLGCVALPQDPGTPIPDEPEPFFDSVEQVLTSPLVGRDNIVYLYEQVDEHNKSSGLLEKNLTAEEVFGVLMQEAERPENADSPLDRMRPGLQKSFLHTTAVLFVNLLQDRSGSTASGGSNSPSGSNSKPKRRRTKRASA